MKVYIAGKITNNPNYKNEFEEAEKALKLQGYEVMTPHHMNTGFKQSEYWHVCKAMIDVCDTVYFLPTWEDSKGSCFEMGYAEGKGKNINFMKEDEK